MNRYVHSPRSRPTGRDLQLCLVACAVAFALSAQAQTAQQRYDAARDQYEIGHFAEAFAVFAELADTGHCEAARMARQMARHGRTLYATEFAVTTAQITRWQRFNCSPVVVADR